MISRLIRRPRMVIYKRRENWELAASGPKAIFRNSDVWVAKQRKIDFARSFDPLSEEEMIESTVCFQATAICRCHDVN